MEGNNWDEDEEQRVSRFPPPPSFEQFFARQAFPFLPQNTFSPFVDPNFNFQAVQPTLTGGFAAYAQQPTSFSAEPSFGSLPDGNSPALPSVNTQSSKLNERAQFLKDKLIKRRHQKEDSAVDANSPSDTGPSRATTPAVAPPASNTMQDAAASGPKARPAVPERAMTDRDIADLISEVRAGEPAESTQPARVGQRTGAQDKTKGPQGPLATPQRKVTHPPGLSTLKDSAGASPSGNKPSNKDAQGKTAPNGQVNSIKASKQAAAGVGGGSSPSIPTPTPQVMKTQKPPVSTTWAMSLRNESGTLPKTTTPAAQAIKSQKPPVTTVPANPSKDSPTPLQKTTTPVSHVNKTQKPPTATAPANSRGESTQQKTTTTKPNAEQKPAPTAPAVPALKTDALKASVASTQRVTASEHRDVGSQPKPAGPQGEAGNRKLDSREPGEITANPGMSTDNSANRTDVDMRDGPGQTAPNYVATVAQQMIITNTDPEVKEWLELTGFFNEDYRKMRVARRRKIVELEEERARLMREEEIEMLRFLPLNHPTGAAAMIVPATPIGAIIPAKRPNIDAPQTDFPRPEKAVKTEAAPPRDAVPRRPATASSNQSRDDGPPPPPPQRPAAAYRGGRAMKHEPPPPQSPPRGAGRARWQHGAPYHPPYDRGSPPPFRREFTDNRDNRGARDRNDGERRDFSRGRRESADYYYDNHNGRPARRDHSGPAPRHRPGPGGRQPLDLGRRGDSRFYIIKSFNDLNVQKSMESGLWTTSISNGEMLSRAFEKYKNVLLFFSVNKSKAFQGYARMSSVPVETIERPSWMRSIQWETTPPFRVEWLLTEATDFWSVHYINNPFNEDRPIIVGKDGQEIEEEAARTLVEEMHVQADKKAARRGGARAGGGAANAAGPGAGAAAGAGAGAGAGPSGKGGEKDAGGPQPVKRGRSVAR